jgi:hypothetical protein
MNKKPINGAVCLLAAITIAVCTAAGAPPPVATPEPQTELMATLSSLTDHIEGKKILDATQIEAHKRIIECKTGTRQASPPYGLRVHRFRRMATPLLFVAARFIRGGRACSHRAHFADEGGLA